MTTAPPPVSQGIITYEQYISRFSTESPTTQPYEILDGILFMVQTPNWRHQRITSKIHVLFRQYEERSGKGLAGISPFDVVIRRTPKLRTRQPDVFFISHERLTQNSDVLVSGPLQIAPELVVEIVSPSDTPRVLEEKIQDYIAVHVEELRVVRPDQQSVEIVRLSPQGANSVAAYHQGDTVRSVVFPDLTLTVAEIFAE